MANIKKHLDNIKGALFGKDVRSSIHDGIDAINKEVESTTNRQEHLEDTFDQLVINSGNSNAEIVDARVGENGKSYAKLGDRLDEVDSQLEHNMNEINEQFNTITTKRDIFYAKEIGFNLDGSDEYDKLKNFIQKYDDCELVFDNGTLYLSENIIIPKNISLIGYNVEIKSGCETGTIIKYENIKNTYTVNVNVNQYSTVINLPNIYNIELGDIVVLNNYEFVSSYKNGIIGKVLIVNDDSITINTSSHIDFVADKLIVAKALSVNVTGFNFKTNSKQNCLILNYVEKSNVFNNKIVGEGVKGVTVIGFDNNVYKNDISKFNDIFNIDNVSGYGITVSGHNVNVFNNNVVNCRHNITSANREFFSTNLKVYDNIVSKSTLVPLDFHGNSAGIFENNKIYDVGATAIQLRNSKSKAISNKIYLDSSTNNRKIIRVFDKTKYNDIEILDNEVFGTLKDDDIIFYVSNDVDYISRLKIKNNINFGKLDFNATRVKLRDSEIINNIFNNTVIIYINSSNVIIKDNIINHDNNNDGLNLMNDCINIYVENNKITNLTTTGTGKNIRNNAKFAIVKNNFLKHCNGTGNYFGGSGTGLVKDNIYINSNDEYSFS